MRLIAEKLVESANTSLDGGKMAGEGAFRLTRAGEEAAATITEGSTCKELANVTCRLETKELWEKFHELGTEMIITKSGR